MFSSGRRMALEELSRLCHASMEEVKNALEELKKEYEQKDSSLMIVEEGNFWKLTTREHYLDVVKKIVTETELTKSLMETLAVIAFKYPILQSEVIKIRTNKAYDHLKELEEIGYITRQKHGRTNLIKLTDKFFTYFSLTKEELKDKFRDFGSLAEAIEKKEEEIEQAKKEYGEKAKAAKEHKEKLGQLIVVEEEEMPPEVPTQIIEDKQMLGPLEVVEELPEQQKAEEVEEGIAEEALAKGKTKRAKKHIFESGEGKEEAPKKAPAKEKLPPEIARRVEQRVEEILHPPKEEEESPEIEQPEEIGAEQPEEQPEAEDEMQKEEKEEEPSEDIFSPEQPPIESPEQPGEGSEEFFAEEPEKEPTEEEATEEEETTSEELSEEPEETGTEEEPKEEADSKETEEEFEEEPEKKMGREDEKEK